MRHARPAPAVPARTPAIHAPIPDCAPSLEAGRVLDAAILRHAMSITFGKTDTRGTWV